MTVLTSYDTPALLELLPHRPPILMIDRLEVAEDGSSATGYKSISVDEPCFQQTEATGSQAYPHALIVESLGQAAAALWLHREAGSPESAGTLYFAKAEGVTFLRDVFPGDDLVHEIRFDRSIRGTAFMSGRTLLNGEQVAVVESIIAAAR